ncbi:helix-turn-helix transcriptional regulator [Streptomyces brasiliscabiei]|uniref:Helix-turn-helix transcriptional regulator n=1 Tax=Streptomyces brasiliscabiei TaxID=2736302 RepID=A0ABU8GQ58_9ACTN
MAAIHDDVAEFALLLTRLKERTDRSYAALARRLGTHASTLHRYCAGEAVPLDFSGIERFAALCGASPGERVELHRRWILAVAARQRSRSSDARRSPAPHATTGIDPSRASADCGSPAEEAPEPTSPSDACPGPTPPTVPPSRTGRTRRRALRSTLLAASLAVALAGLTASAAGPLSGSRGSSASAGSSPKPSVSPTSGDTGPRSAAPSAAAASSAAASSSAGGSPSASAPTASDDGGPRKNRTETGTAAPPPTPLTWTANSHVWADLECEHDYVIAKPPRQVPPPPAPQDAEVWAASLGAVHGRNTNVRMTVQGRGDAAVVLEALHVRVVNRTTSPAAGRAVAYSTGDGCGATLQPRYFSVDLDAHRPRPRAVPAGRPDSPSYAVDFPYRVSLREPEVLLLAAGTESCTCEWYLELDWSSEGRSGTVRIDDHGRPFRTTTINGLPHYRYDTPSGWVPMTTTYDGGHPSAAPPRP